MISVLMQMEMHSVQLLDTHFKQPINIGLLMKKLLITTIAAVTLSGCATVSTDKKQRINVLTNSGQSLEATLDGRVFQVPGTVEVNRDGEEKVINTLTDGCAESTAVNKEITTAFWGNIIIGGLGGSTTDGITGKMWDYDDQVMIQCVTAE
jgi:hypothetical protein